MPDIHPEWQVRSSVRGRIRLRHPLVQRSKAVARALESTLLRLEGVRFCAVNALTSNVLVKYDPGLLEREALIELLDQGLRRALENGGADDGPAHVPLNKTVMQISLSSTALALSGTAVFVPPLAVAARVVTFASGLHIFRSAAEAMIVERKLKVDVLDAVTIALALKFRLTFAAALMVWLVDVSDTLLDSTFRAAKLGLTSLFGQQTRSAWRIRDGQLEQVAVELLEVGDRVLVRTGEQIPVDGRVVAGAAMVDQAALTGEYAPAERVIDDAVSAMTAVVAGELEIAATRTGEHTSASRMVSILEASLEHQVHMQLRSEKFADDMVIPTLGLGAIAYLGVSASAMLAVVNADFGTGVRIAGPLALLTSLSAAARHGVMIKNGSVLETIRQLDVMIFDKTGTLTEEVPDVGSIHVLDDELDEARLLTLVAAAERHFTHPIARAVLKAAGQRNLAIPEIARSEYEIGLGVRVEVDGCVLLVGSERFMAQQGVGIDEPARALLAQLHVGGSSTILAALDGKLAGMLELEAAARPEARQLIAALREQWGIKKIYMISGDHEAATSAFAAELGIDDYVAGVLPEQKATIVRQLQDEGYRVGMVGDGINDSVALSQADVSFSFRGAADIATDVADVVFMDGDLSKLELTFRISQHLTHNVKRSIVLTLAPNIALISGALAGIFGFGSSLVLNNAFNIVACVNGLRAQRELEGR